MRWESYISAFKRADRFYISRERYVALCVMKIGEWLGSHLFADIDYWIHSLHVLGGARSLQRQLVGYRDSLGKGRYGRLITPDLIFAARCASSVVCLENTPWETQDTPRGPTLLPERRAVERAPPGTRVMLGDVFL